MQNKAKSSWAIANEFVKEDELLNLAANRFYYALYQAAWWRNEQLRNPLTRQSDESYHAFVKRIVMSIANGNVNHEKILWKLKTLRIKADYKPVNVKRYELQQYDIMQASQLFKELLGIGEEHE